jgi:hypothetical protein
LGFLAAPLLPAAGAAAKPRAMFPLSFAADQPSNFQEPGTAGAGSLKGRPDDCKAAPSYMALGDLR